MTLAGSDEANYFGKQNMVSTAFRRKTGRSSSIFNLRIVNHVCSSQRRSHEAVGELADITKTLNLAMLLSSFLSSRFSLSSRKSKVSVQAASTVAHLLCRERRIGCIARGLRDAEFQSLVIVITVILENNFELPGEPPSASRVYSASTFFLDLRFFFKHC